MAFIMLRYGPSMPTFNTPPPFFWLCCGMWGVDPTFLDQGSNLCPLKWNCPTPVLLPGKSHGRRSLVGCMQSMGSLELDMTEQLHFHFSLSCIGEGNGNPLQCSCLENPRDGGAWWAAVYGVAQSRTRLRRLSSSSNHQTAREFASFFNFFVCLLSKEFFLPINGC